MINVFIAQNAKVIFVIIEFYCLNHSIIDHKYQNRYHIFQHYNTSTLLIDAEKTKEEPFTHRVVQLDKACGATIGEMEDKRIILITLFGQIRVNFQRVKCRCCSYVKDFIFNGIFPGSPGRFCNNYNFSNGF